ncbi:MAG: sigma 54-interacting transcriptional regulator, partial [Xanthomonadales bacterium]|nr:sigma 54-interacting transcriptional regulator [Xanthomonadales bacterium]
IYLAIRDGQVHQVDSEVFWCADGSYVPVEYTSTPIIEDDGICGAVVVFRDISARKEMERQRKADFQQIKCLKDLLEQERDYLRDEINVSVNFGEIVGDSQALKRTFAQIEAVAPTSASVLINGESGVGKEMIARAIHQRSPRADAALVKVNCASIPGELFESEFFGHVKGAFTGAHKDRVGRLQLASGGTLFLDEVGEIPLEQQGKLLRALQEGEFERVGDEHTTRVDVRVLAATNRDLQAEIGTGHFRQDLFYRLSVFPIDVPPLRQRSSDIVPLAMHFTRLICKELGKSSLQLTQQQADMLSAHDWPGNVRELKNVIERAVILSPGDRLRLDLAMPGLKSSPAPELTSDLPSGAFLTETELREYEKENMRRALEASDWRISGPKGAAERLGIKPSTLTYRMTVFGIKEMR